MRKITEQAARAFRNSTKFNSGNTSVAIDTVEVTLSLHGNTIAKKDLATGTVTWTLSGWNTTTTRERLNGVVYGTVRQRNHEAVYIAPNGDNIEIDACKWYDMEGKEVTR